MDCLVCFFIDNEIIGSLVIDDQGDIVGIVIFKDIIEFCWNIQCLDNVVLLSVDEEVEVCCLCMVIFEEMGKVLVEVWDIMIFSILLVDEQMFVCDIVDIMMCEYLYCIFVIREKKIIGIIMIYDMLKLILDMVFMCWCIGND